MEDLSNDILDSKKKLVDFLRKILYSKYIFCYHNMLYYNHDGLNMCVMRDNSGSLVLYHVIMSKDDKYAVYTFDNYVHDDAYDVIDSNYHRLYRDRSIDDCELFRVNSYKDL